MYQFVKRFCFIFLMMLVCTIVHAQRYSQNSYDTIPGGQYEYDSHGNPIKKDTSNETLKHRDQYEDSITIFFHRWDSTGIDKIDSSINDFYSRFPVPWTYYDLGNLGSAAKSFIFQPNMQPGF